MLAIVGVTNAINLSDGLDGLAGGSSLLIFICIAYLAHAGAYIGSNHFISWMSLPLFLQLNGEMHGLTG